MIVKRFPYLIYGMERKVNNNRAGNTISLHFKPFGKMSYSGTVQNADLERQAGALRVDRMIDRHRG